MIVVMVVIIIIIIMIMMVIIMITITVHELQLFQQFYILQRMQIVHVDLLGLQVFHIEVRGKPRPRLQFRADIEIYTVNVFTVDMIEKVL